MVFLISRIYTIYGCKPFNRKVGIFSDDENEKPSESPKQMDDSASDDESTKSGPTSPAPQNDSDKENSASDDDDDDDVKGMELFSKTFFRGI